MVYYNRHNNSHFSQNKDVLCAVKSTLIAKDAAHFLGKVEPTLLPKTADNVAPSNTVYTGEAMSLFDKLVAYFSHQAHLMHLFWDF